jgi:hypothetical protein
MNFAEVERDYIRSRILPNFDWAVYATPTRINPVSKPVKDARVAMVTTAGIHVASDPPFDLKSRTGDPSYREIPGGWPWINSGCPTWATTLRGSVRTLIVSSPCSDCESWKRKG